MSTGVFREGSTTRLLKDRILVALNGPNTGVAKLGANVNLLFIVNVPLTVTWLYANSFVFNVANCVDKEPELDVAISTEVH